MAMFPRSLASVALLTITSGAAFAQPTISDARFTSDLIHSGEGMISMAFSPAGHLFVAEKRGRILVLPPNGQGGFQSPQVFVDMRADVFTDLESGLLGMAIDPNFAVTRHLYVFYTTRGDQRLVRLAADASTVRADASRTVILSGLPRAFDHHKAGDIQFHPSQPDLIYVSIGDDGDPSLAQNPDRYHGKILRVTKSDGRGVADNPYWDGNADSVRSRVWAVGLRNPFRFTFHPSAPVADVMYVSDNGDATDRLSWVKKGSDGSWGPGGDGGGFLSPPDTNHKVMFTQSPSVLGVAIASSGPFADANGPVLYLGNWLVPAANGSISRWRLVGNELDRAELIDTARAFVTGIPATDMIFGPDGALYTSECGNNESIGGWYKITRIRANGGRPPNASLTTVPSPPAGEAPLTVRFMDTSTDPDGTIVSRNWNFGDGATSTDQNPEHTYAAAAEYPVTLVVRDDSGWEATARTVVAVTQTAQVVLTGRILDARTPQRGLLATPVDLRLYRPGATTPLATINVAGGTIDNTVQVPVAGGTLLVAIGEGSALQSRVTAVSFPVGARRIDIALDVALSDIAVRGRTLGPDGSGVSVDLGLALGKAGDLYAFAGGRDYTASMLPASGVAHRVTSDALGYYYMPIATADADRVFVDVVADTGSDRWLSTAFTSLTEPIGVVHRDVTLAPMAGAQCESPQTVTGSVSFADHIRPMLDANCVVCHDGQSAASAGLDLTRSQADLLTLSSAQVAGRKLVVPGDAAASYLFEKIRCPRPTKGARMHAFSALTTDDRDRIAAWIDAMTPTSGSSGDASTSRTNANTKGDCGCDTGGSSGAPWFALLLVAIAAKNVRRGRGSRDTRSASE